MTMTTREGLERAVGVAWRWWTGELLGLLPARLRGLPRRLRRTLELRVHADRVQVVLARGERAPRVLGEVPLEAREPGIAGGALRDLLRRSGGSYDRAVIRVPEARVLRRRMHLPAAARASLEETVGYDLDRQTPFEPGEVYYGAREVPGHDADATLEAELEVVRRDDVDRVLAAADAAGLRVDRLDSRSDGPDLLPPERRPPPRPGMRRVAAGLALVVLLLAGVLVYLPLHQLRQDLAVLDRELAAARAEAVAVEDLRQRIDRLRAREAGLLERKRTRPMALQILASVTEQLPNSSFLIRFGFDGGNLEITGYSERASALVGRLEAIDQLNEIGFRSPVTTDPRISLERFDLGAKIVSGGNS